MNIQCVIITHCMAIACKTLLKSHGSNKHVAVSRLLVNHAYQILIMTTTVVIT